MSGFTLILIEIMFLFKFKNHIRKSMGGQTARGDNLRGYTGHPKIKIDLGFKIILASSLVEG